MAIWDIEAYVDDIGPPERSVLQRLKFAPAPGGRWRRQFTGERTDIETIIGELKTAGIPGQAKRVRLALDEPDTPPMITPKWQKYRGHWRRIRRDAP